MDLSFRIASILHPQKVAPPRKRTKPMAVLCMGPPRSATDSLAAALRTLGYTTYHGWDIVVEQPSRGRQWMMLTKQKWGPPSGDSNVTTEQFDELMGHADAVLDTIPFTFPSDLIAAYPEAKVILNKRKDLDAWHRSILATFVVQIESAATWWISRFSPQLYWTFETAAKYMWPLAWRSGPNGPGYGLRYCGKWVYREHCAMVRGLMIGREDQFLEWSVEDGWEPLCKFLDKDIPEEPFPRRNDGDSFNQQSAKVIQKSLMVAFANMALLGGVTAGLTMVFKGRIIEGASWMREALRSAL